MTAAATSSAGNGPQSWWAPEGYIVALRRGGVSWCELRALAVIGGNVGNTWGPDGPHPVHSFRKQAHLGEQLGLNRRSVSELTDRLADWIHKGEPVLRKTREGSHSGCKAYWVRSVRKGARQIRLDVLTSPAVLSMTDATVGIWLCLRDDYKRAANGPGLDCTIKGRIETFEAGPRISLARRYRTDVRTMRRALNELEAAGLITVSYRMDDQRFLGIRVKMHDEPPPDAHIGTHTAAWLEPLAGRIAVVLEELRSAAASVWSETLEPLLEQVSTGSSNAAWAIAGELRGLVRRAGGSRYSRRTLSRAVARHAGLDWRRPMAREAVGRRDIVREEFGEAAAELEPERALEVLAGLPSVLPTQGPALARDGLPHDVTAAELWARARRALSSPPVLLHEISPGNAIGMFDACRGMLERSPADGQGPVLWLCARSLSVAGYLLRSENAEARLRAMREATQCRIGARELPGSLLGGSRGPP